MLASRPQSKRGFPVRPITLFLCGDVMTGRGIDQILPRPSNTVLYESFVKSARDYLELAERRHGRIPAPVNFDYIWGDALKVLAQQRPDARIINLETAVTASDDYWRGKGINYRMHPDNVGCLTAAGIDCCVLANNHVLDWGYAGLDETLRVLQAAGMQTAGAGPNLETAAVPAVIPLTQDARVIVFAFGAESSGVPASWAATETRAGVNLLRDAERTVRYVRETCAKIRRAGDMVLVSIHWGANWGYEVSQSQQELAHQLIDEAQVDLVHGHSSHHVKAMEVYKGRLVLYGCGDFINDYEGIGGYDEFRSDLALMYFPALERSSGELVSLRMVPMQTRNFRSGRATPADAAWLHQVIDRQVRRFGAGVDLQDDHTMTLNWQ
ncbi:MAG: CapA family protein [Pseudomonadota bacterium]|nr:MAG: CapA family protein [Pseudomonadota bacterium]